MSSEVELKFACDEDGMAALRAHPRLAAALERDATRLRSVYFDTPDHDLAAARISCRIRDDGARRVQTVKAERGVASRHEWECETADDAPDLSRVPVTRANAALRKADVAARLAPVFTVDVERETFALTQGSSLIELAIDRGWISAGESAAPIAEVELELKQGHMRDLFALARDLVADLPLTLALRTKSERGYRLAQGHESVESDTPHPPLADDMSFPDGLRLLGVACLRPLVANGPLLLATRDADALHQTRTAVRRLRALLAIFKRHVQDSAFDDLRKGLKWISRRLGAARDLDVAGERWAQEPATAPLAAALADRRAAAYDEAIEALRSQRYRLLLLDVLHWLACGSWTTRPPKKRTRGSFADVWLLEAQRWDKRILKGGAEIGDLDADERHEVRIKAKSFHYVVDLTEALVARADRRAQKTYRKALKKFQSTLGDGNDLRVAEDLLASLAAPPEAEAAARKIMRAQTHGRRDLLRKAQKAYEAFRDAPRPWPI